MSEMVIWFVASLGLGALGVWLARQYAIRMQWLDHPNKRSFHDRPTPRIGGLGLLLPVLAGSLLLVAHPGIGWRLAWLGTLLPALLVGLLSFFDDCFDLSRLVRFGGHVLCGLIVLVAFAPVWGMEPLPLLGDLLPLWLAGLLLLVWITGLTNSYNFMDGIDGIAAIQGLVAIFGWVTVYWGDPALAFTAEAQKILLLALAGGLAGFLILNWAPASIFMGDIGSTFLGFYLAVVPFGAAASGLPFDRALEAGVFFVWPFVADAGMTFTRRLASREPVFEAHRSHLYQVLAATFETREKGHRLTSLLFGLLSLVGIGLYWTEGPLWAKLVVLGFLWIAVAAWTYGLRAPAKSTVYGSTGANSDNDDPRDNFTNQLMPFEIYLSPPEITDSEKSKVMEAFSSGFIAPVGPQVNAFERELAAYLGLPEIQAVSSGTAAIHLGLRALGVGPGDCVLCPDLTFIASVNPVRYLGAEPVLVDVDPQTWAIDPHLAREAIRTLKAEGRTVRAMVIVHALGVPAPMDTLMELAETEGVPVLEDCAGAFGTRVGERSVGTFGKAAAFSFNGNKVLTTSGGGAVFIRDPELREAARSWANQGKKPHAVGYSHDTLGYNYKLSNICAAIGLGQLETLSGRLERKKATFRHYQERLRKAGEFAFIPEPAYGKNNYWLTCIGVDTGAHAGEIVHSLREKGIEAAPMWKPMHLQKLNRDLRVFGGAVSEAIHRNYLSLPSGSNLTREQVEKICDLVLAST